MIHQPVYLLPLIVLIFCVLLVSSMATRAQILDCGITGTSTVEQIDDPLGMYLYTIEIHWDSGGPHGQSHLNVGLGFDIESCPGVCDGFSFGAPNTAGFSTGVLDSDCTVYYYAEFECRGDPSIESEEGAIVKFEPYEDHCEPGNRGEGTFFFYSDWPPASVETPNELLSMKFDQGHCVGELVGWMPECSAPVPVERSTWGRVKSLY